MKKIMYKEKITALVKIDSSILKKVNNQLEITNRLVAQSAERIEKSNLLRPLIIEGTKSTPSITCDAVQGLIAINGRSTIHMLSTPLNVIEFYKPLLDWLDQYVKKPSKETKVTVQFEHLDTCGLSYFIVIFKKLEPIHKSNNQIVINWHYEEGDEIMLEEGEDFESIIRVPFKMIPYKGGGDI